MYALGTYLWKDFSLWLPLRLLDGLSRCVFFSLLRTNHAEWLKAFKSLQLAWKLIELKVKFSSAELWRSLIAGLGVVTRDLRGHPRGT